MKPLVSMTTILLFLMTACFDKKESPIAQKFAQAFSASKALYLDTIDQNKFQEWEKSAIKEHDKYKVKKSKLNKTDLEGISVRIIGAAWCSDTREQVSRFVKILDFVGMEPKWVNFHMLDRAKEKSNDAFIDGYYFSKVPEFIIYRDEEKIGSIIEVPKKSLEEDLVEILAK